MWLRLYSRMRSVHCSRTERTKRSACGLQLGLRGGIFVTVTSSLAKTASKAAVKLAAQFAVHAASAPPWVVAAEPDDRSALVVRYRRVSREGGWVHLCLIRRWCQASRARGETIRCPRSVRGSWASAASSARSGHLGFGVVAWRRSTATS